VFLLALPGLQQQLILIQLLTHVILDIQLILSQKLVWPIRFVAMAFWNLMNNVMMGIQYQLMDALTVNISVRFITLIAYRFLKIPVVLAII